MSILLTDNLINRGKRNNIFFADLNVKRANLSPGFHTTPGSDYSSDRVSMGWRKIIFWRRIDRLLIRGSNKIIAGELDRGLLLLKKAINIQKHADIAFLVAIATDREDERKIYSRIARERREEFGDLFNRYGLTIAVEREILPGVGFRFFNNKIGFIIFLAEMMSQNNELKQAIELLQEMEQEDDFLIKIFLGRNYINNGNLKLAIDNLQQVEQAGPDGIVSALLLAIALRKKKLSTAAITILRKIRRDYRFIPPGLRYECSYQLARTMEEEGSLIRARKEYEKIIAEDFDYADIQSRMTKINLQEA